MIPKNLSVASSNKLNGTYVSKMTRGHALNMSKFFSLADYYGL